MRKLFRLLPLAAVLLLATFLLAPRIAWYWKSDTEKIEYAIHAMAAAGRDRHVARVLEHIAEDYRDHYHSDREALRKHLTYFLFLLSKRVAVTLSDIAIEINPDHPAEAVATFNAVILISRSPNEEPDNPFVRTIRGTDHFRLRFRKEGSVWRVIETEDPEK